jgi:hypothetical protein
LGSAFRQIAVRGDLTERFNQPKSYDFRVSGGITMSGVNSGFRRCHWVACS